ncbi:ABC transporter ATP-binding protein [Caldivirga sp.]|uniref:ABC transporter ATP-binding protein n=1 Tax=Caldivirga sp. TaxID=2080243 RepID=UPI003D11CBB5
MSNSNALKVEKLMVKYGEKVAVKGISFTVNNGEVYCLLGPNGAGKTSTIKAVLGLVKYEGLIDILGLGPPLPSVMNHVGVVMETPAVLEALTVGEFIEFLGSVRGTFNAKRVETLLEAFELKDYVDTPIAALSAGNKQKVAIVAALMHEPRLLLLDEPFNFLDVKSVRILKEIMQRHIESGGSILFSTHIMEVAERVCSRIGIINEGVLVTEGTPAKIKEEANAGTLEDAFLKAIHADEEIKSMLEGL